MPHMSLQSLNLFGHGVEVFSIILLPRGLHSPKSGTDADDSALIVPGKDVKEIELQLTKELKSISNWLTDNKLYLHLGKTESILFGTKKKLQCTTTQINVTCGGSMLSAKSTVKYLGVELDQHLSGEYIARNAISNIHNKVKFL